MFIQVFTSAFMNLEMKTTNLSATLVYLYLMFIFFPWSKDKNQEGRTFFSYSPYIYSIFGPWRQLEHFIYYKNLHKK